MPTNEPGTLLTRPHRGVLRRAGALAAVVVLGLGALAGCGDDDDATPTTQAEGGGSGEDGGAALEFIAVDIDFERDEVEASAGELEVTLVNDGAIEHSWLVEGHEDDLRLYTQSSGATDEGTLSLDAGTYTYYCDIPGHRSAGMEGTLTLG